MQRQLTDEVLFPVQLFDYLKGDNIICAEQGGWGGESDNWLNWLWGHQKFFQNIFPWIRYIDQMHSEPLNVDLYIDLYVLL